MNRRLFTLIAMVVVWTGCHKASPPATSPPENAAQTPSVATTESTTVQTHVETETPHPPSVAKPTEPATPPDPHVEQSPEKTARVMLLTAKGPLLVDLHVTRGDQTIAEAFEQTIDSITQIARGDQANAVTWKSLLAHPRFQDGQFGNPVSGNYQAQANMIRQYDTIKNGRVDRNELIRYLTNNQTSRAISFFTSSDGRIESREGSELAKWLDQDGDRRLSAEEQATASARLQLRDTNDDGLLTPDELVEPQPAANGMAMPRSRRRQTYAPKAGWLFEITDTDRSWSDIRVAWETLYSVGQSIRRDDFALSPRIFDQLDLDKDGSLDNIEMEMLTEIDPDLALHIDFASTPPGVDLLASRFEPESIQALIQHQSNRITLRLPDTTLDVFAVLTASQTERQSRSQIEAFLQQADEDNDGSLTSDEYTSANAPLLGLRFDAFDIDGDEMITRTELDTIVRQRGIVNENRLRIRADNQSDALFPTLDTNADGRLDAREIASSPESLASLDRNGDAQVRPREFSGAMMVGVVLGGENGQPQAATDPTRNVPIVQRTTSESTPVWFIGMDRNADQSISWREFLGTKEQFQQLDADEDGFVDAAEATRG